MTHKAMNLLFFLLLMSCGGPSVEDDKQIVSETPQLDLTQANRLAALPLKCIQNPFPYKPALSLTSEDDLQLPQDLHPAFYGCFDWHSAVHGHWVLVNLLKQFPNLDGRVEIIEKLDQNLTADNMQQEIAYFSRNDYTKNFERTYGWAWVLKLAEELYLWDDPLGQKWYANIQPLAALLSEKYISYLPKLTYPIRVGEHTNTAFGLVFAWDYADTVDDIALKEMIEQRALDFYKGDLSCPIHWEPSGYDFLSPCLQEADIMSRVLSEADFRYWFNQFLPGLRWGTNDLVPATIKDRSDGKLVHLDGLNFSRAWCLYPISQKYPEMTDLKILADQHLNFSLPNIIDGDYAGEHWLASFALYALNSSKEKVK